MNTAASAEAARFLIRIPSPFIADRCIIHAGRYGVNDHGKGNDGNHCLAERRVLSLHLMIRRVLAILSILGVCASALVLGVPGTPLALAPAAADYPTGEGYWLAASDGGIFTFGDAQFYGSTGNITLNKPIVGLETYPFLEGYWLVATDGGVFTFGSAPFLGSTGNIALNKPIVGMASTPSGNGYWLVASDGGIFTFGDAQFLGSTGGIALNKPIVGMSPTPSGNGYRLVATDGGIFTFGDASFLGSQGGGPLNKPIVGMETTKDGNGYYLVASDGGLFTHGNAVFRGSRGGQPLNQPVVGMALSRTGLGYQLVATDGGIFNYGDSKFFGSTGDIKLNQPILGMDIRPAFAVVADAFGTSAAQSSEWVQNGVGDFQLVLQDTSAGDPPAGARILGVEGFDVDQLGTLGFTVEPGSTCNSGGPQFILVYDTNGNLKDGGVDTAAFACTGGPGDKTFTTATNIGNAQVVSLDLVYENNGGPTVTVDDIRVAGLTITDFNVVRAA